MKPLLKKAILEFQHRLNFRYPKIYLVIENTSPVILDDLQQAKDFTQFVRDTTPASRNWKALYCEFYPSDKKDLFKYCQFYSI